MEQPNQMILDREHTSLVELQSKETGCGCNGGSTSESSKPPLSFVYALGQVEPRFPSLAVEKEIAQAIGRGDVKGLTDWQSLQAVLSKRENRYLARRVCWVFTIEGLDTYLLGSRDPLDLDVLLEAIRNTPRATDVDVVVGVRGPLSPPEMCNGLILPIVFFSQVYSFDVDTLVKSIPRPEKIPQDRFGPIAEEIFGRIMQLADNTGSTDEHRALNYLAVRYPGLYATVAEEFARNTSLSAVEARPSRLSNTRKIVDVVFTFTHRETDVANKFFVRVDVTEEFPFLVTKLSPYYDR
jgi:hypothetical protein